MPAGQIAGQWDASPSAGTPTCDAEWDATPEAVALSVVVVEGAQAAQVRARPSLAAPLAVVALTYRPPPPMPPCAPRISPHPSAPLLRPSMAYAGGSPRFAARLRLAADAAPPPPPVRFNSLRPVPGLGVPRFRAAVSRPSAG